MQIETSKIEKPEEVNFILGQAHFIKTVEDLHEALVNSVPGIKFGLAFCESSGKCLVFLNWNSAPFGPCTPEVITIRVRAVTDLTTTAKSSWRMLLGVLP